MLDAKIRPDIFFLNINKRSNDSTTLVSYTLNRVSKLRHKPSDTQPYNDISASKKFHSLKFIRLD